MKACEFIVRHSEPIASSQNDKKQNGAEVNKRLKYVVTFFYRVKGFPVGRNLRIV